jgi:hypothetical protein
MTPHILLHGPVISRYQPGSASGGRVHMAACSGSDPESPLGPWYSTHVDPDPSMADGSIDSSHSSGDENMAIMSFEASV